MKSYALAANVAVDLYETYKVVGLDLFIHNRGAVAITFIIDEGAAITVLAGDSFFMSNTKFSLIAVTSAVNYDMMLAGVYARDIE